jgi:hypothetical protein
MKTKELLKQLKKVITKGFGWPCKDFQWACTVCSVWLAYTILEDLLED